MAVIHSPQLAAGVGPRPGWSAADDVDASAAPAPTCARARDPMLEGRTGSGREPFPSLGAAAWLEQQQHQHRQQRQQPYTQLSPNRNHHQLRNHAPGCNKQHAPQTWDPAGLAVQRVTAPTPASCPAAATTTFSCVVVSWAWRGVPAMCRSRHRPPGGIPPRPTPPRRRARSTLERCPPASRQLALAGGRLLAQERHRERGR
jgi:hypothetical protein